VDKKLRRCLSGPEGGDVQIAIAVIDGLCDTVLFFQDPRVSHPHESDIRYFEQIAVSRSNVHLCTNPSTARLLLLDRAERIAEASTPAESGAAHA
jgi:methylglyoxal synthase